MDWLNTDPRHVLIDRKHAEIVILRPNQDGAKWTAGTAHVEVKHGWYIRTSFADHRSIDRWDPDWLWVLAPDRMG